MDQFGLNMNFLGILQVSAINFILKIIFLNHLSLFTDFWTARIKTEKCRGLCASIPRRRAPLRELWINSWTPQGFFYNSDTTKGYGVHGAA